MSEVTEQPDKDSVEVQFNIRPHPGEVNRCDAVCESILRCQSPDCLAAGPILIEEAGVRLRGHWHCCVWIIAIIAGALSIPFGLTMGLLRIFLISGELYKGNINGTSTSVTFDEALWYSLPHFFTGILAVAVSSILPCCGKSLASTKGVFQVVHATTAMIFSLMVAGGIAAVVCSAITATTVNGSASVDCNYVNSLGTCVCSKNMYLKQVLDCNALDVYFFLMGLLNPISVGICLFLDVTVLGMLLLTLFTQRTVPQRVHGSPNERTPLYFRTVVG